MTLFYLLFACIIAYLGVTHAEKISKLQDQDARFVITIIITAVFGIYFIVCAIGNAMGDSKPTPVAKACECAPAVVTPTPTK